MATTVRELMAALEKMSPDAEIEIEIQDQYHNIESAELTDLDVNVYGGQTLAYIDIKLSKDSYLRDTHQ